MPPMQPVNNIPKEKHHINIWLITTILLFLVVAGLAGLSVWLYSNYTDQKTNVDGKIEVAVSAAKKAQSDSDNIKFTEREKEPYRQFVGPDDYGRVTFKYPKTWSAFVNRDATTGGNFEAYLNPVSVPPISQNTQYAIRVFIEERNYDLVLTKYDSLVKKGDLKATGVVADDNNGTRLDGNFTKNIRGSAVIFKIRDKTLTIRTDANTFVADFNKLISTIKFNQ